MKHREEDDTQVRTTRSGRKLKAETKKKAEEDEEGVDGTPAKKPMTARQKAAQEARLKAIAKTNASKRFQRQQKMNGGEEDDDDAAADLLDLEDARETQYSNCELCDIRFVVTPYSRTGPDGGLLCTNCSKELDDKERAAKKRKLEKNRMARRETASKRLEGKEGKGANDLVTMGLNTLAKHIQDAAELGDMPPRIVERLSMLLSKHRLIDSKTLDLFLDPSVENLPIYDGAKLKSDDYIRVFQMAPNIKRLRARNAIQFKGKVMQYLVDSPIKLTSLSLHGANLLDDSMWLNFFEEKGQDLDELKVYYTDVSFGDSMLEAIATHCPNLTRLKICHNQQVTDAGLYHIAKLDKLQHLGLDIYRPIQGTPLSTAPFLSILSSVGSQLRTLSLRHIDNLDDTLLQAIHYYCKYLKKLRLRSNEVFTDKSFASLFTDWQNPPLSFVDLGECRHLDSAEPAYNTPGIGLADGGFRALMGHSGESLKYLNIVNDRHISEKTFMETFDIRGKAGVDRSRYGEADTPAVPGHRYPRLEVLDCSFCWAVDDFVVAKIWESCPALKQLKVFGNFGVKDAKVPRGRILLGCPNNKGLEVEGEDSEVDEGVDVGTPEVRGEVESERPRKMAKS